MSQSSSKQYVAETNNRKATLNAVSGSGLQEVQSRYLRRGVSGEGGVPYTYMYIYIGFMAYRGLGFRGLGVRAQSLGYNEALNPKA